MTQQNCRPCQGIQSITPRLLRNVAGQNSMNYRIGSYGDFFESMLAALSRNNLPVELSQNIDTIGMMTRQVAKLSNERSPLRYLTAREKDDPSIAMLDAWAVLADVLTFYNERYVSEAYLRTAMQSSSLFELANLVGYTPRPGLSSSVYLTFEVDDKGEEIEIPKGTQAKSTPLPGSGQTSETFETSQTLIGRPSLNKIRPRLTRPNDLRETNLVNLDRLYLKGIGLRIQPNDFIAIGARAIGTPNPFKVLSVSERRDSVRGPITVLYFKAGEFSTSAMFNEIQSAIEIFFTNANVVTLFTTAPLNNLLALAEKDFRDRLETIRVNAQANGLVSMDRAVMDQILIGFMLEGSTHDLRRNMDSLDQLLVDDTSTTSLKEQINQIETTSTTAIKDVHSALSNALLSARASLGSISLDRNSTNSILDFEQKLFSIENSQSVAPKAHIALRADQTIANDQQAFPDGLLEFDASLQTNLNISYRTTKESAIAPAQNTVTPDDVKAALVAAKRSNLFADFDGYAVIEIREGTVFVAAGVQYFKTGDTTATPNVTNIIPEKIRFDRRDLANQEISIDSSFSVGSSLVSTDFAFEVDVLEGNRSRLHPTPSVNPAGISAIQTALQNLTYTFDLSENRATFLITILKAGEKVAYALRTLIVDGNPIFVRNKMAEALVHGDISLINTDIDAKQRLADGASTAILLTDVVRQSRLLGTEIDHDKYPSMSSSAFSSRGTLRNELMALGTSLQATLDSTLRCISTTLRVEADELANPSANLRDLCLKLEDAKTAIGTDKTSASTVIDAYIAMANAIQSALNKRRELVKDRLKISIESVRGSLSSPPAGPGMTILSILTGMLDERSPQSVAWRLAQSKTALDVKTKSDDVVSYKATLEELIHSVESTVETQIKPLMNGLDVSQLAIVRRLLEEWKALAKSLGYATAITPSPNALASSISDLLSQVNALVGTGNITLSSFENLLGSDSALWPQVFAALAPDQRKRVVALLRDVRIAGGPNDGNVGVWVLRSNANLFGWNSPGVVSGVVTVNPITSGPITITTTTTTTTYNDPPDNLLGDELLLDGRQQKTLPASPIGVLLKDQIQPQLYWATDVSFAPHRDYVLSGESTRIKLDLAAGTNWFGLSKSFDTIRTTRIFCDAEPLELSEAILSDDELTFLDPESTATSLIELDDFRPELSPGMRIAISGVAYNGQPFGNIEPNRNDAGVVIAQELVTITGVQHPTPTPLISGESIRTRISIVPPRRQKLWRDTVEICANVVEATHGETVSEVLGSGDARKPFQKLPLRRAPLTRLPAPTPDGKQDQLEVIVNNTRWDKVGQLISSDANNEVYELTGRRYDASTTVQFGNGVHGARLPTGVENVKALYRVGLGIAGNVESGQINQLPSPPFGVKGVNNPLRSDGGADPDSIAQTKARIPALASTMRELVSIEDYKNFALLFAGIDKVSIENQSGQLIMFVAGNSPNPLSEQGALLLNLKLAFDQQGDDGSIIRVKPHIGLLLHINARVSVDSRHEWEPIQAKIEEVLLTQFGYPAARLGQNILASDIVKTIQSVDKVNYVVLNKLLGLVSDPNQPTGDSRRSSSSADTSVIVDKVEVFANEICYIDERVASTVQLERIP